MEKKKQGIQGILKKLDIIETEEYKIDDGPTEKPHRFELSSLKVDEAKKNIFIVFDEIIEYREVEDFFKKDDKEYPVYSEWKTKKKIKKLSLPLEQVIIDNLKSYPDELISSNSFEIIDELPDKYQPIWFKIEKEQIVYEEEVEKQKNLIVTSSKNAEECIEQYNKENIELAKEKSRVHSNFESVSQKLSKIENNNEESNKKIPVILIILTLGIICIKQSKTSKRNKEKQISNLTTKYHELETREKEIDEEIFANKERIKGAKRLNKLDIEMANANLEKIKKLHEKKMLELNATNDD